MSLGTGAYKVDGDGKALAGGRRYPWQPCEWSQQCTVTLNCSVESLNCSVEYLLTNSYPVLSTLPDNPGDSRF